ncbi:MAG TPA: 4-hydroxy-tetrahydrodipicolinate synthase [Tissierellia bacterium]|jgi:4-hydroxy-tetrahydrodipicolinate synthase|nr:4-hydroxy-tetrahydrodipicolinate synthase [Tissierellia bacterium]
MNNWGRIITAMVTPMDAEGNVNYDKAVELAKHLVEQGSTALVINGTTGESPTVTADEKEKLLSCIKKSVNVPIIAGVGTNSTAATIENAQRAEKVGVDGLLVVVPYYNKPNQQSLYEHFSAVAKATKLPIMLYNVPGRTGINMTAETSVALSKIPNIVALKEASGDLNQLATVVRDTDDDFYVYTGEDAQILPTLAVGGYGVVSVTAHVVCKEIKNMIDHYLNGNVQEAAKIHLKLIDVSEKLFMTANPIPVKAALNLLGMDVGITRLPLAAPSEDVIKAVKDSLTELGLL